jgi:hypothetical protein
LILNELENNAGADLLATAARLATAAEALDAAMARVVERIDAQNAEITATVDRIVAAIEVQKNDDGAATSRGELETKVSELERTNAELKARAAQASERASRKTLPPLMTALLAKSGVETGERMDSAVLDKTLAALTVEQRIAVKSEMARAGLIE